MSTGMQPVRSIILKVLSDLPGKPVHVDTIVARTNLTPVQAEAESTAPANRTGEVWEVIGHAKSGAPILRDEHGILYRATEMD